MLVRAGLIDEAAYFKLLGKAVSGVLRGSGRTKQSVAESSFDAWGKYYRQDENAPNAIISYYTKGSLVALALDLTIRGKTAGKRSLDDVMRALWQRYGRDFYARDGAAGKGRGITPLEVDALFDEIAGARLKAFFAKYVRGTDDLPLAKLLPPFGVDYREERKSAKAGLDANLGRDGADLKLAAVHEGGAAHRGGLSAGDVLVALDGLRVGGTPAALETLLGRYRVGDRVTIHAFRRDELQSFDVTLQGERAPTVTLALLAGKTVNKATNKAAILLRRPSARQD
jgi:predicted metalloprotease with PDZ domain